VVQDNFGSDKGSGFLGGGQVGCDFQTTNLVSGSSNIF
jgi:outer membrane immunogenic protein